MDLLRVMSTRSVFVSDGLRSLFKKFLTTSQKHSHKETFMSYNTFFVTRHVWFNVLQDDEVQSESMKNGEDMFILF